MPSFWIESYENLKSVLQDLKMLKLFMLKRTSTTFVIFT